MFFNYSHFPKKLLQRRKSNCSVYVDMTHACRQHKPNDKSYTEPYLSQCFSTLLTYTFAQFTWGKHFAGRPLTRVNDNHWQQHGTRAYRLGTDMFLSSRYVWSCPCYCERNSFWRFVNKIIRLSLLYVVRKKYTKSINYGPVWVIRSDFFSDHRTGTEIRPVDLVCKHNL